MKQLFLWLIVVLGLIALLMFGLSSLNEAQANKIYARGQARAMVIEAQGQARLDSAQAQAVISASMFPYLALTVASIFGAVLVTVLVTRQPIQNERIVVLMLPEGHSKREAFEMISGASKVKLLR